MDACLVQVSTHSEELFYLSDSMTITGDKTDSLGQEKVHVEK